MFHEKVLRDDNFWKYRMEDKLIDFYENYLVPEIINSNLLENTSE